MRHKVLITSSSFLDTPGEHLQLLGASPLDIVTARGPLSAEKLIEIIANQGPFEGVICGEDEFNIDVINTLSPQTKVISKYGVGIDKIDLSSTERKGIAVKNTPGVNHASVAELTFGLMLSLARYLPEHNASVHSGNWRRMTGVELCGKTLGIVGFGRVGREVALRAMALGMKVIGFNSSWSKEQRAFEDEVAKIFASSLYSEMRPSFQHVKEIEGLLEQSDFVSLHMNLTKDNRGFFGRSRFARCKRGAFFINVSRAALIDESALIEALRTGQLGGFATDVYEPEPIDPKSRLLGLPRVVLTPHIGSRTVESVQRQGLAALRNLLEVLNV